MVCGNGYKISRWSPEIERAPAFRGLFVKLWFGSRSDAIDVLGLQTLGTLLDLEFHLRAFVQRTVAVRLDSRKVHKHVIAGGSLDKSRSEERRVEKECRTRWGMAQYRKKNEVKK